MNALEGMLTVSLVLLLAVAACVVVAVRMLLARVAELETSGPYNGLVPPASSRAGVRGQK